MTLHDINRIFELLGVYFPNSPKLQNESLKNAWLLVLKPFEPAEVKRAVVQCLREKKYFPDVTDVSTKCHMPTQGADAPGIRADAGQPQDPQLWEWWTQWRAKLKAAGLPTPTEALGQGMPLAEYSKLLEEVGL